MEYDDALDINLGEMRDLPSFDSFDLGDMQHEKFDYDAALDAAYEYEAGVIEKGIRDQVEQRARDYLSKNGDAVWARIQRAIVEAERLVDEHPGASLVSSMTAAELMVRFMLLRPMLAGLVIDPAIADRLAAEATQGIGARDRKLLPHVCRAWDIDLGGARVNDRELWPTLGGLWQVRHDAVHRGEAVTVAQAKLALGCAAAVSTELLGPLVAQLRVKWPDGPWLAPFDEPADPLAMPQQPSAAKAEFDKSPSHGTTTMYP
jgi:ElaB/YqjD/DUF883 family membrane-anchored ribosome-binding protein